AFKMELDIKFTAALLKQVQHQFARHAAEAVAGGANAFITDEGVNVVPIAEVIGDQLVGLGVGFFEVVESFSRKDHTPAEGVIGLVALENADLRIWVVAFEQ